MDGKPVHTLSDRGAEVMTDMNDFAESHLLGFMKDPSQNWQPSDFLPDPTRGDFRREVLELRERCAGLPDALWVVLVGDMITEEALPTYMGMLNTLDGGVRDETGASPSPWATWTRKWTAEENRHGDLLNKYLWLSGQVDLRAVEATTQSLIGSGMDAGLENNPYLCFVYTSFQERATKISHGGAGRLAAQAGEPALAKACGLIAADEGRHEEAYKRIVAQILQRDPDGGVLAFADMLHKSIVMPGHMMEDGVHAAVNGGSSLFADYSAVVEGCGVYTALDYAAIVQHLVDRWDISHLRGLSSEAAEAQQFVCEHGHRVQRLAERAMERRERQAKRGHAASRRFSWISGRAVEL